MADLAFLLEDRGDVFGIGDVGRFRRGIDLTRDPEQRDHRDDADPEREPATDLRMRHGTLLFLTKS